MKFTTIKENFTPELKTKIDDWVIENGFRYSPQFCDTYSMACSRLLTDLMSYLYPSVENPIWDRRSKVFDYFIYKARPLSGIKNHTYKD